MIYLLARNLIPVFPAANLFTYITFRAAMAAGFAILILVIFGRPVVRKIKRLALGEEIYEELPERHKKKQGTPSMGGILIVSAIIISLVLFADITNPYVIVSLFILVFMGLLGFLDDYIKLRKHKRGIKLRYKLIVQVVFALAISIIMYLAPDFFYPGQEILRSQTNVLFLKNYVIQLGIFYILLNSFVIVGGGNAVNFADGLDGLSIGLLAIVAGAYAVLAYVAGNVKISTYLDMLYVVKAGEMAVVCATVVGAGLGFLWFNAHPASIFMGDTGSLPLGALMGFTAVVVKQEVLLGIIGGVFVLEVLSVILQIIWFHSSKGKKRLFRMAPLHHHFELKGWAESKIVVRFWIWGILFALAGLATLKVR
ncbi:phospho-N-acetylmuramoyl-pentapeptide-transferase [candidate division WOR-3 bacterium]|nr:phospho-N-acetylmuramoyl-pentapeptide-transferase [candidate division WOR-3 bacterium]